MKLTVPQKTLSRALAAIDRVVARKDTIPILTHVRLEAHNRKSQLDLIGTDLSIECRTDIEGEVDQGGACCVPAATLSDIVKKFDGRADVAMQLEDGQLILRAGRSRFKLPSLPVQDFPESFGSALDATFKLPTTALARLIEKTSFAMSTEETRYYLNGVFLHHVEGYLRAVATDGHRLARVDTPAPEGAENIPGVIVPKKTVDLLGRMIKDAGVEEIGIALSSAQIRFVMGRTTILSKLVDGTFPDYGRVIPANGNRYASLDVAALTAAVARVTTISGERGRAVKFAFDHGRLKLSVVNPDAGEASDEVDHDWEGQPIEIGFNGAYVQELLAAMGGARCIMKFTDPGAPALMSPVDDDDMLAVLMPMRV